ncbi:ferredoxin [Parafrankia sp. FMc6]|uniref:ferredoxin n=1 Tax=Parafrankia soli TaxID=2599596 RepID=UPI0034D6D8BB
MKVSEATEPGDVEPGDVDGDGPPVLTVQVDRCIGAGQCVRAAPDVFDQDPATGTVVVLPGEPSSGRWSTLRRAADRCPSGAVSLAGRSDGPARPAL